MFCLTLLPSLLVVEFNMFLLPFCNHNTILVPPRLMLDPPQQMVRPGDRPLIICTVTSGDQPIEIEWFKVYLPILKNPNIQRILLLPNIQTQPLEL